MLLSGAALVLMEDEEVYSTAVSCGLFAMLVDEILRT